MAADMVSWRDKYLAFRTRHQRHLAKAGESTQKVGQAIVVGGSALALSVADQKWGKPEPRYPNLHQVKIGPVPVTLLAGAAGLGLAVYGSDEKWSSWAESGGLGAIGAYSAIQGRRMVIDWEATQTKAAA